MSAFWEVIWNVTKFLLLTSTLYRTADNEPRYNISMTDIKQLKAELAQAKKNLKAEVKRTKEYAKLAEVLTDRLFDCETIFEFIDAIADQHNEIAGADLREVLDDIRKALKLNTKALDLRARTNAANCTL